MTVYLCNEVCLIVVLLSCVCIPAAVCPESAWHMT